MILLTILFAIFILWLAFKIIGAIFNIGFGLIGALLGILFIPAILILAIVGLFYIAIPVFIIGGIVTLIVGLCRKEGF